MIFGLIKFAQLKLLLMSNEYSGLDAQEQLKAENEFLKMKLMLENGAIFRAVGGEGDDLPPEIENEFLNNILEFEKQWENTGYIKVFDKLGAPMHFLPHNFIPDDEIGKAWEELSDYLLQKGITLDACSPRVTPRELYRFTMEELFDVEMEDISIPGLLHGFIYDEFHPDPYYENMKIAMQYCIQPILQKEPVEWLNHFHRDNVRLNQYEGLTGEELKNVVNHFKEPYDDIEFSDLIDRDCYIDDETCVVRGEYSVFGIVGRDKHPLRGDWKVMLKLDAESGEWYIAEVEIDGIKF